ncbi:MAG: transcription termination/antitermination protein NusA, partial [Mucinivorans sp.]
IRLASMLTGYDIDVYREGAAEEAEDDVDLKEFSDEIEEWIIDALVKIGYDTARSVLAQKPEELAARADLEIETVEEVMGILRSEFE